jgi:uncharacterized tellurite resistance protein B-like protein
MKELRKKWESVQYGGDIQDTTELIEKYNVEGFITARRENEREQGGSLRSRLLRDHVLLTSSIAPRIYSIVHDVQERLGVTGEFEVFCLNDSNVNAFAHIDLSGESEQHVMGITSAALEHLEDDEIASLIGHEMGHFIFGHNEMLALLNRDKDNESVTVLPYLGECLFVRWRKKSEISADRLGLVAAGSFEAAARALIKAGYGLSGRNLNLDIDALLKQIESVKDKPEAVEAAFRSHPLLPLRLQALRLFQDLGQKRDGMQVVDKEIDALFAWFKRYPRNPVHEAVMKTIALAGMNLVSAECDVDDEEIRTIIYLLHSQFTDEPEKEIVLDVAERDRLLTQMIERINEDGETFDKQFVICRLAEIALADGKLLNEEAGSILQVAEALGMTSREAYGIIVAAAQNVGFKVDYRMKELVKTVRMQLMQPIREAIQ